ncbi:FecR domain-containing protein [Flavobacterium sp.]|uniref:FecR family protein n=1 Tax=Flavobacterium sp. TaxID=239 RepID=UPI00286E9EEE|nr:FecR domain-containing protein [Flavobacterium sp.]
MKDNTKKYFRNKESALHWVHELFERYFQGEATEKEKKIVEKWDPEIQNFNYKISDASAQKICDDIWLKLSENFDFDNEMVFENTKVRKIQWHRYSKFSVAASITFFMGLGFYFFYFDHNAKPSFQNTTAMMMTHYKSGEGEMKKMMLPDGSVIYLNSDTKLALSTKAFNKQKREVWLQEGEAFFEVAKDPSKPFIVHTQNIETTVKGTAFNVKAYGALNESAVSVKEGKVEVNNNGNVLGILTANKQITYNKTTKTSKTEIAVWEDATAWMDHRLVMYHASADELKLRLKQHFGVEVILQDKVLKTALLNASFKQDATLTQVAESIGALYMVKYKIVNTKSIIFYK